MYLIGFEGGKPELFTFCLLSSLSPHPISKQQAQIVNTVCDMYLNVPTHVTISIKATTKKNVDLSQFKPQASSKSSFYFHPEEEHSENKLRTTSTRYLSSQ